MVNFIKVFLSLFPPRGRVINLLWLSQKLGPKEQRHYELAVGMAPLPRGVAYQ